MIRIVRSTVIDAPTDRVWALLRDFNGHDRWHPAVAKSTIERGQSADKLGCVRRFFLRDGSELRERLLTSSDLEQTFSYCLLDTPVPLFNYVAHVRLAPVTDGDRTFWDWRCSFTTRKGEEEEMRGWSARKFMKRGLPPFVPGLPHRRDWRVAHERHRKDFRPPGRCGRRVVAASAGRAFSPAARWSCARSMRPIRSIETIVRSTDPTFSHISVSSGRVELGAGVTMAAILAERELAFLHPVARTVGGPAVREAATVGGNLFAPSPYGDFAAALLALDATVVFAGGFGQREVPLDEFLSRRDRGATLVASVAFRRPATTRSGLRKSRAFIPRACRCCRLPPQLPLSSGRVSGARIAYDAMDKAPLRAKSAERALEGRTLDAAGIAPALAVAADGTAPVDDAIGSAWWRREILPVHLRRLLLGADQTVRRSMKTPIQFRLNGEDVATFVESGANLLDTFCASRSAISRSRAAAGKAPAAPARC